MRTPCAFTLLLAACAAPPGGEAPAPVTVVSSSKFVSGQLARACGADLDQRAGPGANYAVLRVIPDGSTIKILTGQGDWYQNDWTGHVGWTLGADLCALPNAPGDVGDASDAGAASGAGNAVGAGSAGNPAGASSASDAGAGSPFDVTTLSRDNILGIAAASVGYSYFWGHAMLGGDPAAACYGSCPSCTHSGTTGADCSGLAGKAWLLPEAMPVPNNDSHPFSTVDFYGTNVHWSDVPRSAVLRGDALVYRQDGHGHIFIYDSGDGWGSMWAYEARGCATGVVHDLRTAGSLYKAITRDGL